MHASWNGCRSLVVTLLCASLAFVSSCRETGSARGSKDEGRIGARESRVVFAEVSESGRPEWHYKIVHSSGEPIVELRFQISEGSSPGKSLSTPTVDYVMMGPPEKVYRFVGTELFAKAAEYQKTRYHRLEDFEVSNISEVPLFMQPGK